MRNVTASAACILLLAGAAFAGQPTATPTPDTSSFIQYGTLANEGKTEINKEMNSDSAIVVAIVTGLVCFSLLIRMVRRGVRSKSDSTNGRGMSEKQYHAWKKAGSPMEEWDGS